MKRKMAIAAMTPVREGAPKPNPSTRDSFKKAPIDVLKTPAAAATIKAAGMTPG